ncbi:unnamed protein product [Pseudo-nitzschia multistriata]|uniref:Uncharacterized protein n=1 Tax=Pseudo-nitzschia multistriata TaxID=183589 RepID=A0A448ZFI4_9STRA|nr:unnamed protein product [Pseudo-nitzschia multistriata]
MGISMCISMGSPACDPHHGGVAIAVAVAINVIAIDAIGTAIDAIATDDIPTDDIRARQLPHLLGLPEGHLPAVPLHVQGGVVIEEGPLVGPDGLPAIGDPPGQVPEADLPVGLAALLGHGRVDHDVLDGEDGFGHGSLLREAADDAGPGVLEEDVVGAQGALGLVLGFLPGAAFLFWFLFWRLLCFCFCLCFCF